MERLDDASVSFFVFFSQEGIFMDASYNKPLPLMPELKLMYCRIS
jgi:hypothetical protein